MWTDFKAGFKIGLPISIAFFVGLLLGHALHPYESCNRMYTTLEDVSECIWIKEN